MSIPNPQTDIACFIGEVRHRRLRPAAHQFSYRSFFFRLDAGLLDSALSTQALQSPSPEQASTQSSANAVAEAEADKHFRAGGSLWPLFGLNRPALISMHANDHGSGRPGESLSAWLMALLNEHGVPRPASIRLLAYPRVLGYQFKPVSFWLCDDENGDCVAVVAEVHNTFSGRHAYVLSAQSLEATQAGVSIGEGPNRKLRDGQTLSTSKCFTVSPFCTISGLYRFRFYNQKARSLSRIEYHDEQGLLLITSLSGQRIALSKSNLLKLALGIPWQSLLVIVRIHWQALKLWLKKVPFFGPNQTPPPPQSLPSQGT